MTAGSRPRPIRRGSAGCGTGLTLTALRENKELAKMVLLQKGSRLSVQPVTEDEFQQVMAMAGQKGSPLKKAKKSK